MENLHELFKTGELILNVDMKGGNERGGQTKLIENEIL